MVGNSQERKNQPMYSKSQVKERIMMRGEDGKRLRLKHLISIAMSIHHQQNGSLKKRQIITRAKRSGESSSSIMNLQKNSNTQSKVNPQSSSNLRRKRRERSLILRTIMKRSQLELIRLKTNSKAILIVQKRTIQNKSKRQDK